MRKISVIARACAIFGIHTIYVYKESGNASGNIITMRTKHNNRGERHKQNQGYGANNSKSDADLIIMTLRYLETPQFLRKRLFAQHNYLKFAGVMLPLQIPSHVTDKTLKKGQIREGVIVTARGRCFLDVGVRQLLQYMGNAEQGRRITIRVNETTPNVTYSIINRDQIRSYWGYLVKYRASLQSLLAEWNKSKNQIIITSRKGKPVLSKNEMNQNNSKNNNYNDNDDHNNNNKDDNLHLKSSEQYRTHKSRILRNASDVLVVFGSPDRGVHEILGGSIGAMSNARVLNFFPNQQTATVRLDEALVGVLAMINAETFTLLSDEISSSISSITSQNFANNSTDDDLNLKGVKIDDDYDTVRNNSDHKTNTHNQKTGLYNTKRDGGRNDSHTRSTGHRYNHRTKNKNKKRRGRKI